MEFETLFSFLLKQLYCFKSKLVILISSSTIPEDDGDVTCYCKKPYGGKPMIECSSCSIWVHLTCAKVKRTAIPDIWYCALCKTKSTKGGAKARARAKARKNAPNGILSRPPPSMKKKS